MRGYRGVLCLVAVCFAGGIAYGDVFVEAVRERVVTVLSEARSAGEVGPAYADAVKIADVGAGYASARQLGALGWGEAAVRLLGVAQEAGVGLGSLVDQPGLCLELGLLLDDRDDGAAAVRLAGRLSVERAEAVAAYPALAAAICVVHDVEYARWINENRAGAPDPVELFDYFVDHASMMKLDPADTPALLLVHVVDVTESIDQLGWALRQYGANPDPGARFFEIEYDVDHYRRGVPKKVTQAGDYRITSIKEHGGVCADQAYFAETVGKANGIPTAYVRAAGADVSHAWIGYLDVRRARWDFDAGRYEDYQDLRGTIRSPQTGETISDADAGVLGGLLRCKPRQVHATLGARLAAVRMASPGWSAGGPFDDASAMNGTLREPRGASIEDRLGLLKSAMTRCASVPGAWEVVRSFAAEGELSQKMMDEWARAVERMSGKVYPDFSFDVVRSLIGSVEDADDRQRMWEWAFGRYRSRPDLASAVRFEQGRMFAEAGRLSNAWAAYENVVKSFLNDGPMSVEALRAMREILEANGKGAEIIPYLEDAAGRVRKPGQMGSSFARQSNFYKIHAMLAEALDEAGRGGEARRVRERAGIGEG